MISIVVPTYKEAENLPHLSRAIADALRPKGLTYEVLFIDDDSQDGSEEVVAELSKSQPVRIIVRKDERSLVRTGREDDFAHAHLPQPLARRAP